MIMGLMVNNAYSYRQNHHEVNDGQYPDTEAACKVDESNISQNVFIWNKDRQYACKLIGHKYM